MNDPDSGMRRLKSYLLGRHLRADGKAWGHGSILRFQVWDRDESAEDRQLGTFEIWYADWTLKDHAEAVLLTSDEADCGLYMERLSQIFNSPILVVDTSEHGLQISFANGCVLKITANNRVYDSEDDVYCAIIYDLGYVALTTDGSTRVEGP